MQRHQYDGRDWYGWGQYVSLYFAIIIALSFKLISVGCLFHTIDAVNHVIFCRDILAHYLAVHRMGVQGDAWKSESQNSRT
jgi:hypothetical protein